MGSMISLTLDCGLWPDHCSSLLIVSASLKMSQHPAECQLWRAGCVAAPGQLSGISYIVWLNDAGLCECESRTAGAGASFDARGCCRYSGYLAVLVLILLSNGKQSLISSQLGCRKETIAGGHTDSWHCKDIVSEQSISCHNHAEHFTVHLD